MDSMSQAGTSAGTAVSQSMNSAGEATSSASSTIATSAKNNEVSFTQSALAANNVATSAMSLYNAYDSLSTKQLAVDKATQAVTKAKFAEEKATQALEDANFKLRTAEDAVYIALQTFGADSPQWEEANNKLSEAKGKVALADENLAIKSEQTRLATEQETQAQNNLEKGYVQMALTVLPSMITMITSLQGATGLLTAAKTGLSSITGLLTGATTTQSVANGVQTATTGTLTAATGAQTAATTALGGAMSFLAANPIVLIIAAIAALALGLYYLYENNETVKNAIDAFGKLLSDIFSGIVKKVMDLLTAFWENVLVPIGNFIKNTLQVAWENLGKAFQWVWDNLIKPVADALKKVYDTIFKPIGDFLNGVGSAISGFFGGLFGGGGSSGGTKMATGGIVTEPYTLVDQEGIPQGMIGEAGPEAVVPVGGTDGSSSIVPKGGSGDGTVNATVNVSVSIGSVESGENLDEIIKRLTDSVRAGAADGLVEAVSTASGENASRRLGFQL